MPNKKSPLLIDGRELDARLAKAIKAVKESSAPNWMRTLSLVTAVLSVFTAWGSMKAGGFSSKALMNKNEAVLDQAKASDQWAFYQSKSIKALIREQALDHSIGDKKRKVEDDLKRYEEEKGLISNTAKGWEAKAGEANDLVAKLALPGGAFGFAVTLFQVGIALSGLAALTKRQWIWYFGMAIACGGLAYFIKGYVVAYQLGLI